MESFLRSPVLGAVLHSSRWANSRNACAMIAATQTSLSIVLLLGLLSDITKNDKLPTMQLTTATTQKTQRNVLECDNDVSLTPLPINRHFRRATTCSRQRTMATVTATIDVIKHPAAALQSPQLTDVKPRSAASPNIISTARSSKCFDLRVPHNFVEDAVSMCHPLNHPF